jgi:hypothetical protein
MRIPCPFCKTEKDETASVCPTCGRDTAIPSVLLQERDELRSRREKLSAELAEKMKRLASR